MSWDFSYDVIAVGSGCAGFSVGLTAKLNGLKPLIIEKTDKYGGSSALSGGGVWIPNNHYLPSSVNDSDEEALRYLQATVGDQVPADIRETYVKRGKEVLKFFYDNTKHVRFKYVPGYSDYYPELPGGRPQGRSIEPEIFDLRLLGEDVKNFRRSNINTRGLTVDCYDFHKLNMIKRTFIGKTTSVKVGFRMIKSKITGANLVALGQALVARFRLSYKEANGELWLNTAFKDYILEDGKVVGILVEKEGKELRIQARKGVVMTLGGFSHSQEYREKYLPKPTNSAWSSASPGQTGDFIAPSEAINVKLNLMDKVWGAPSLFIKDKLLAFLVADRGIPNMIVVNSKGERYVNEGTAYHDFVDAMYKNTSGDTSAVPSWIILDQVARDRYLFMGMMPGQKFSQELIDSGGVKIANTLEQLAKEIGVPVDNFVKTVKRFNEFAAAGKDLDFKRGDSKYDEYYADPSLPAPCLYPIEKGPFYAMEVFPGDIGTKGGLVIDKHARVQTNDGQIVPGLYAAGNTSASIMGETYPGAGSTLGPAMVMGYLAVQNMLGK